MRKLKQSIDYIDIYILISTFILFFIILKPYDNKGSKIIEIIILCIIILLNIISIYMKIRKKH